MSSCCSGVQLVFDERVAKSDLKSYRLKGPSATIRLMRDAVRGAGGGETLIDVGAGVGALTFELIAAGFRRSTIVDASTAYLATARAEAERRGLAECVALHEGDFVAVGAGLASADAVVMNRVVCCYPEYAPLLEQALAHSRHLFAMSFPHDRWWARLFIAVDNRVRALRRNPFRAYVHPPAAMAAVAERLGFRRIRADRTFLWAIELYARDGA
jgi:2-polyprenyl-3-methyl-5-hydroxy-6-metoxy-1,4-benzoquinol methylase